MYVDVTDPGQARWSADIRIALKSSRIRAFAGANTVVPPHNFRSKVPKTTPTSSYFLTLLHHFASHIIFLTLLTTEGLVCHSEVFAAVRVNFSLFN